MKILDTSVQFSCSVVSNSFNPMNRSMPDLPVHQQLPEFTQTHVHQASDAIQPSHPLSPHSPPPPSPSKHQSLSNESALRIRWPKNWSFSFNISLSKEHQRSPLGWTGWISLLSKRLSRIFSNTTVQKHQSLMLNLLYGSIHA